MSFPLKRFPLFFACGVLLAGVAACGGGLPDPSSETYREAVAAFYAGVTAMQVGEDQRADAKLTRVTELVPEEPAAWADLGLLALRRNAFEVAFERLEKARSLAPDDSRIHLLIGLGKSVQGSFEEALPSLRRAVELDSTNVKALFALAQAEEKTGAVAEAQRLLDRILALRPGNLAVLLEKARLAAEHGDAATLNDVLDRLAMRADGWPEEARARLVHAREAAADPERAVTPVIVLRNVLLRTDAYRDALAEVQTPLEQVGEVITEFIRLPKPRPTPAPPDDSLAFFTQPVDAEGGPWQSLRVVLLDPNGGPAVVLTDGVTARWLDEDRTLPFPGDAPAHGILGVDFDNDFWIDLAFAGGDGLRLFRQDSTAAFVDVTARAGLPAAITEGAYTGVWAADLDLEGDLDLVLGTASGPPVTLRNDGDGGFEVWPLFDADGLSAFAWADLDADGDPDAALLDARGRLHVFSNARGGRFMPRVMPPSMGPARALDASDLDADAHLDLVVLQADGALKKVADVHGGEGWMVTDLGRWEGFDPDDRDVRLDVLDFDNNGGLDVLVSGAEAARLWLSDVDGRLREPLVIEDAHVFGYADFTGDGRLDLMGLSPDGRPVRLVNQGVKPYHWRQIRPQAAAVLGDRRINTFGIGGEIELRAGLIYQKQPIEEPVVYFGLGDNLVADVARIIWPNGDVQAEFDLLSDEILSAQQRLKGSCPWLFTYDGEKMTFVTDFIWRSPLGLKINALETAGVMTTEDRVRIRGDQLVPRDGYYDVRITAELWETHFFDHVSLLVVDHPADTDVFVDERFAFPPPALDAQPAAPPHPVARVWTDTGEDVTDRVRARDERYLDFFGRGKYQGITRDHFIEIDLGDAPVERPLWLVASGWVRPTDSSINVAISQGAHPKPRGLRMDVPDGRGGWTTVHPNLGFPSGKEKTILIDLEGVFPPGAPHRVRLHTNLEIYWDALAWAEKRPDAALRMQRLAPETAELRYRGFSEVTEADRSSPELPDYETLAGTSPVWRDLVGYYTRFGDVRELLAEVDDRYVIMNAGDEMVFRFPAPPPPPEGWTRDFVLIGDGWVKDGDYNTAFSKTVLPLPAHDRPDYTTPPGRLEDDPVYLRHPEDWQTYHTRYVTPRRFYEALRPGD